ncbi:MAG: hypothetical protein ABRQ38_22290 [Candidatus Eremiobacterota bacterium]
MERYNSEYSTELINKMNTVLEGEERYILLEYLEKTESAMKILLRKIKINLKKGSTEEQKDLLIKYIDTIKEYIDMLDDINLFLEDDSTETSELEEKINNIQEINKILLDIDTKLHNIPSRESTAALEVQEIIPKETLAPNEPWHEIDRDVIDNLKKTHLNALKLNALENYLKHKKLSAKGLSKTLTHLGYNQDEIDLILTNSEKKLSITLKIPKERIERKEIEHHSSMEIAKITRPALERKKLTEQQYEDLNNKLQSIGITLSEAEIKLLAECGFQQRINMSVLNRILNTLEEVLSNYGEIFLERVKTLLFLVASNYLFIYDISKFYINFQDERTETMDKIVATLNAGLSIAEYLSSIMKVMEIAQVEESELLEDAVIIKADELPYDEWIRVNEYEINMRYKISDLWKNWYNLEEDPYSGNEDDYILSDENLEELFDKLTYLELKIERLPHALESPWELSAWIKELFTALRDHSLKLQQWSKIKKAESISGLITLVEECFANPNLYSPKGESTLLKLSKRVEFMQSNILIFLRQTVDSITNHWDSYRFPQGITYLEQWIIEKGLIAITFTQTAIDQIQTFYQNKNMLELVFSTQVLTISNKLLTLGLEYKIAPLHNSTLEDFMDTFIGFHIGQVNQEVFLEKISLLAGLVHSISEKHQLLNNMDDTVSIVKIFIQKSLGEYMQAQSDIEMYKTTHLRLFLLTTYYSLLQATNRFMVIKELKEEYTPEEESYKYFDIISDVLAMI